MHLAQNVYRLLRAWGADLEIRAECTDVSLRMLFGGGGKKKKKFSDQTQPGKSIQQLD